MSKAVKATIGLMLATIFAKVLGFGRELVLGAAYGATSYSDAYITALNIPIVIFAAVGTALSTTFIPLYYDAEGEGGEKGALRFSNNILNLTVVLCIVMSILCIAFAKPLVKLFAFGFEGEVFDTTVYFTKVLTLGIVFIALSEIFKAILQIKGNFVIPGLYSLPQNIIIIISIALSVKMGPDVLIWGTLIAMSGTVIIQLPYAYKKGYKYSPYLNIKDKYINKMIVLVGPIFIGIFVTQLNTLIDRTLASTLVEGSISALNYASKLNGFIVGVFIASIVAVIYPILSRLSIDENKEAFNDAVVKSSNTITLLVLPVSVGAMVLSKPIVQILFQRGVFDERATNMTAIALVFYSIGLIGGGFREVFNRVFYALKDTKTPMINGIISVVMNIVLNVVLVRFMGHAGLALATSISANITIILLFISLKKKVGYFGQDRIIKATGKSLIAAIIMGISTYLFHIFVSSIIGSGLIQQVLALGVAIIFGATIYGILIVLMKVDEVNFIIELIKNKLKK